MTAALLSLDDFRAELRGGARPAAAVQRLAPVERWLGADTERSIPFCLSDGSVDRMGDTLAADGWELDGYLKNPVVLWAHDASAPPIGRMRNLRVSGGRLLGTVEFAAADIYPFADLIYRQVKAGYINAGSVGFIPIEYAFAKDKERPYGIDFTKQELLEFSIVPIPANANALIEARQHLGRRVKSGSVDRVRELTVAALTVAGCAIDRQRERQRAEMREGLRRERQLLYLGLRQEDYRQPNGYERQRAYVARLGELLKMDEAWQ